MVIVNFDKCEKEKDVAGLWQYDYGQVLRIQGLQLQAAVEIHFSLKSSGADAVTRVGVTKDGVTDVVIPDSMLENDGFNGNYCIYAFLYKHDEESGETTHKISLRVRARPKPEAFETPETVDVFRQAIDCVNEAMARAEDAGERAQESEEKTAGYLERTEALAEQVDIDQKKVGELAAETERNTDKVQENAQNVHALAKQVDEKAKIVGSDKEAVVKDKKAVEAFVQQVTADKEQISETARQVELYRQNVAENTEKAIQAAEQSAESTRKAEKLAEQVETYASATEKFKEEAAQYAQDAKNGVQSDWAENDESSSSYVKNRTHFKEMQVVYPETVITPKGEGLYREVYPVKDMPKFEIGQGYIFVLNGTEYNLVAEEIKDSFGMEYVGFHTEDFQVLQCELYEETIGTLTGFCGENYTEDEYTVSLKTEGVHYLDPVYIEDMYYTEKKGGEVEEKTVIVPLKAITIEEHLFMEEVEGFKLKKGATYEVTWNSTKYRCSTQEVQDAEGASAKVIGNLSFEGIGEDTGEPFMIIELIADDGRTGMIGATTESIESVMLSIELINNVNADIIHKIPNKYLDMEWLARKNEVLYVKNETVKSGGSSTAFTSADVTVNDTIVIYVDGVRYECSPITGEGEYFAGNVSIAAPGQPNTGESVLLQIYSNKTFFAFADEKEHVVSVGKYKYNKLPWNYMPDMIEKIADVKSNDEVITAMEALKIGKEVRLGNAVVLYAYDCDGSTPSVFYIDSSGLKCYNSIFKDYTASDGLLTAPMCATDVKVGQHLEVAYNNVGEIVLKAVEPWVIQSSTSGSKKKFKITVDDAGTIKATEVV